MMNVRNHVQLVGHLGADPELKTINNGNKMVSANLAVSSYYKNKEGEIVTNTQWHTLKGWGKIAEKMNGNLKKGNQVAVYGKLDNSVFEGKDGQKKYYTAIIVNEFFVVNKKVN